MAARSTGMPHAREHTYRLVRDLVHQFTARVIAAVEADVQARVRSVVTPGPRRPRKPPRPSGPGTSTATEAALAEVKQLIERRYAERLTLDMLARKAGLSLFFLARTFRHRYGQPIHQYLNRVRVERARDLLRQGRRAGEVARQVGFSDQPHMTRTFRVLLGVTPGQVRRGA